MARRARFVVLVILIVVPMYAAAEPTSCVSCVIADDACLACGGGDSARGGSSCRTGGSVSCPHECYSWGACDRPLLVGPAARFRLVVFVSTNQGGGPFMPPPYGEMDVHYAETMVGSSSISPERAVSTDGYERLGIEFAWNPQLPNHRVVTLKDLVTDRNLVSGVFTAGTRLAVNIPDTDLAICFEWAPVAATPETEVQLQRNFVNSLEFNSSSRWYMVQAAP